MNPAETVIDRQQVHELVSRLTAEFSELQREKAEQEHDQVRTSQALAETRRKLNWARKLLTYLRVCSGLFLAAAVAFGRLRESLALSVFGVLLLANIVWAGLPESDSTRAGASSANGNVSFSLAGAVVDSGVLRAQRGTFPKHKDKRI